MPAGRPTLYSEELNEGIVTFCAQGYSLTAYAGEIGVARQTITEWCKVHPEFSVAAQRAKAACARWWEDRSRGVALDGGPGGQATMVIFGLKNHAPDDYADRHELTGKDGKDLIPQEVPVPKLALVLLNMVEAASAKNGEPEAEPTEPGDDR